MIDTGIQAIEVNHAFTGINTAVTEQTLNVRLHGGQEDQVKLLPDLDVAGSCLSCSVLSPSRYTNKRAVEHKGTSAGYLEGRDSACHPDEYKQENFKHPAKNEDQAYKEDCLLGELHLLYKESLRLEEHPQEDIETEPKCHCPTERDKLENLEAESELFGPGSLSARLQKRIPRRNYVGTAPGTSCQRSGPVTMRTVRSRLAHRHASGGDSRRGTYQATSVWCTQTSRMGSSRARSRTAPRLRGALPASCETMTEFPGFRWCSSREKEARHQTGRRQGQWISGG